MLKIYPVCDTSERKSGIFLHLDGKLLSLENSKTITDIDDFVREVSSSENTFGEFALVRVNSAGVPVSILQTWSARHDR